MITKQHKQAKKFFDKLARQIKKFEKKTMIIIADNALDECNLSAVYDGWIIAEMDQERNVSTVE